MVRRKRKSSSSPFLFTKQNLGGVMIAISGLYFFFFFMASNAPLMHLFHSITYTAFGQLGTIPFFVVLGILGSIFVVRPYLSSFLTKAFFILFVLLSAIFNFSIVDSQLLSAGSQEIFEDHGGYISRPILRAMEQMIGTDNAWAIKTFIMILFALTILYIGRKLQVPLPSMPTIELARDTSKPKKGDTRLERKSQKAQPSLTIPNPSKLFSGAGPLFGSSSQKSDIKNEGKISIFSPGSTKEKNNQTDPQSTDKSGSTPKQQLRQGGGLLERLLNHDIKKVVDQKIYEKTMRIIPFPTDKPSFPLDIMDKRVGEKPRPNQDLLLHQANAVQQKLAQFGVTISIEGYDIGPSVIQMRIKPDAGVKVATIESLKNDLALSLKSGAMRIIAPIPDTDCVGIQIPNPSGHMIHLSDVLGSLEFRQSMQKSTTNLALGVGIDGTIIIKTLEKMPHLLVAGATGQGKSVGINDFIMSLMFQNSPAELKFLMIDPKQVEMEFYSGLPYLLAPIVTQADKALTLLTRSVEEMEIRYSKLKNEKVKNIDEYNDRYPKDKMYRIVIVIDELADLMMASHKKEVEACITRIAQKARAVGMHLIIATQRPSVNVLTGLIKANIPTRIAFGVVSQIDSRTILGMKGAEDLVGKGDMLYMDSNTKDPLRIQAPFISTPETERIISHLMDKYMDGLTPEDIYHPEIVRLLEGKARPGVLGSDAGGGGGDDDELIEQAIDIIRETGKASTTQLQRKLNIGFARAGRVMDELEQRGIVGPQEGAKARDIYL